MLVTIVTALLPVLVTLILGFFAGRHHDFDQDQAMVLNRMVLLYALPLLLFSGILGTPLAEVVKSLDLFLWLSIGTIAGFLVVFGISRFVFGSGTQIAALRGLAIAGPAIPFVGTPVLGVLFPVDADLAVAAGSLVMNLVQVPLALMLLVGAAPQATSAGAHKGPVAVAGQSFANAAKQPVVWAPVLAFILLLLGLDMPDLLKGSFKLLGQSTGGVALFAVGAVLYAQKVSITTPVVVSVAAKNIILPAVLLLGMLVTGVSAGQRELITVTMAIPTASIAVMFAVEYKVGQQEIASTLFWSTILSVFTMGAFIWLTG